MMVGFKIGWTMGAGAGLLGLPLIYRVAELPYKALGFDIAAHTGAGFGVLVTTVYLSGAIIGGCLYMGFKDV